LSPFTQNRTSDTQSGSSPGPLAPRYKPALAQVHQLRRYRRRHPKQYKYLIQQVRSQIVQRAPALVYAQLALPGGRLVQMQAVKVGLELDDPAERAATNKRLDGQEVYVPSAVLVYEQGTRVRVSERG